jgi:hypothetical protein
MPYDGHHNRRSAHLLGATLRHVINGRGRAQAFASADGNDVIRFTSFESSQFGVRAQ